MSIAHQRRQTTKPSARPRDDSSCIVWSHQPSCSLNAHRGESYTQAPVFATSICRQREGCTHVDNLARRSKAEMEESVRNGAIEVIDVGERAGCCVGFSTRRVGFG